MSGRPSYPQRRHPRLSGYDYSTPGYYFITICTDNRQALFGEIVDGAMRLSPAGCMVRDALDDVVQRLPGVAIDTSIVMGDHVHAIVVLEDDADRMVSLPEVVQRYKALTTKRYAHGVRESGWPRYDGRLWQESFYDHIIRSETSLDQLRHYIVENPERQERKRVARIEAARLEGP